MIVLAVHRPDLGLLRRQVRSLQDQRHSEWTCLVGLDGKDAETHEFVRALVADDDRFELVEYEDNLGHYRHFERLLQAVPDQAAWFALCDQDDVWHPQKLEILIAEVSRRQVVASLGQASVTNAFGDVLGCTRREVGDLAGLLLKNQVTGCFLVADRRLLDTALPFPEGGTSARHDHWLGVAARATGEVVVRPEALQDYVQHSGNAIGEGNPRRSSYASVLAVHPWRAFYRLSRDQWGWRVTMARTLLARTDLPAHEERSIRAVARGCPSVSLLKTLVALVLSRSIRADVALGTLAGALWWPLAGRRAPDVRDRRSLG